MKVSQHLVAVLIGVTGALVAHAAPVQAKMVTHVVDSAGVLNIRVHPNTPTTIQFHSQILDLDEPTKWGLTVERKLPADALILRTAHDAKPAEMRGALLVGTRHYNVTFLIDPAESPELADDVVKIYHRDQLTLLQIAANALAHVIAAAEYAPLLAEKDAQLAAERQKRAQAEQARVAAQDDLMGEIAATGTEKLPVTIRSIDAGPLQAHPVSFLRSGARAVFIVDITNPTDTLYRWEEVRITDERQRVDYTRRVTTTRPPENGVGILIPPNDTVGLTITLANPPGPSSTLLLRATAVEPVGGGPTPSWEVRMESKRMLAEAEEKERERAAVGRLSLHVQGVYGAIWLGNPDVQGDLDATAVKGLGMRIAYGLSRRFAVEAEVMGAGTGLAEFDGGVARSASLGRMQFGGVLRLGDDIIPILRLGLGFAGSSFDVSGSTTGNGEGFELDTMLTYGIGLDVRLGRLVGGIAISGVQLNQGSQSIETALHLGYAWKP